MTLKSQSAFDNTDISKIPHSIKDGEIVYNAQKREDKYTRQFLHPRIKLHLAFILETANGKSNTATQQTALIEYLLSIH